MSLISMNREATHITLYGYEVRPRCERTKQARGAIALLVNVTGPVESELPKYDSEYAIFCPVALGAASMCNELLEALPQEVAPGMLRQGGSTWVPTPRGAPRAQGR
ncbi:MAG TPA: hypothetical protein PLZ61_07845, partial [Candidatus Cryosericum sp.]|nr:hypothetical protein [Candidatus Cryosericum sp.]